MAKAAHDSPEFGFQVWRSRRPLHAMDRAHRHADIEANYLVSGTAEYVFSGRLVRVPPRRLTFFWAAIPHQLTRASQIDAAYWITLPLEWFLRWRLPRATTQAVLRGSLLCETREDPLTPLLLDRWCDAFEDRKKAMTPIVALEVEACVRRLALAHDALPERARRARRAAAPDPDVSDRAIGHILAMTRAMADHYDQFVTTADIARHAGLHPNYAMNLFKSFCGLSLGTYLTRLRVSHAQRLLATTDQGVTTIAMASGFGSVSRFYEAFAAETGQSPVRYRRSMTRPPG